MSAGADEMLILDTTLGGHTTLCDVMIANGRIDDIAEAPSRLRDRVDPSHESSQRIDGRGLQLLQGFTDLYGRLREPGSTRKGTIASESRAALRAGFTTVQCAPDTTPAIDSVATVELLRQRNANSGGAKVVPMAALTTGLDGNQLSELATLQGVGCIAAGQADRPLSSTSVLYSAMEYAASFDMPLFMTPRDALLAIDGCAHAGATATRLGLPGIPVAAETLGLASLLELCRETRCQLHVSRLSSARAVEMLDQARQDDLPVSADVGIHHLYFTDELLDGFDANYHSAVPFRSVADRDALRTALANGVIDAICSDHAPHDADARLAPLPVSEPGLSSYDRFLRLLMILPEVTSMSLDTVLDRVTTAPNRILNLTSERPTAQLQAGMPADLILVDTNPDLPASADDWVSAGQNHPFFGLAVDTLSTPLEGIPLSPATVRHAWVDGHLALSC